MIEPKNRTRLGGFAPRGVRGVIGFAVIAIAAFVFGGLLLRDGDRSINEGAGHDHSAAVSSEATVWTCSMHPQIKLPKSGKCPICFMDLIPLETGTDDDLGPRQLRLSEAARQLADIQTTPAVRAFAEAEVRMVGKVAYDEAKVAYITAWFPGRLDRLFADFTGIMVNKGDHLARIYSPELVAAQEELIQANRAVIALAKTSSPVLRSTAQQTRDAVRDKLRLWGLTASQIEHIETTHETSDHLTIYSPIGGVVVHKDAKEGMYVSTGTRIYTIADLTKLWVMFEAYESDLPWLRFGQRLEFESPSFPGERFEAFISFIDPLVDPKTRTVRVRAVVENEDKKLKPDMFVRGVVKSRIDGEGNIIDEYLADKWISPMHPEIVKDRPGQCDVCGMDLVPAKTLGFVGTEPDRAAAPLLIPVSAPMITGKRAVAYVEIPNEDGPLFEGREIELGPPAGDFYVVKSGIEEGELVVLNGAFKIDSELQLQAKPSMMSPTGGGTHDHGGTAPHGADDKPRVDRLEDSAKVTEALVPVYDAYFVIQMALAKDDLAGAKQGGKALGAATGKVDMSVFSRAGHARWTDLARKFSKEAAKISGAGDIEAARDGFYYVSTAAIEMQRAFGHTGGKNFYLTHCPMAREGGGAWWLQTADIVWNSFYGASMLRCGSIEDSMASTAQGKK
jgi:Cu(I)/Ag(I) efflux system membrane fusion protein